MIHKSAFAVVKEGRVFSFIVDEDQKDDLLASNPTLTFIPFEWDLERPYYPSDFDVVDGELVRK